MKTLEINDKHYIDCKVVLLATDDKTNIWQLNESNHLTICGNNHGETPISREECNLSDQYNAIHLYITSDEEIKEGDWCIGDDIVYKYTHINDFWVQFKKRSKKIIATTNSSLLITFSEDKDIRGEAYERKFSLPQPSKEFIQSYIESYNSGCAVDYVLVEIESYCSHGDKCLSNGAYNKQHLCNVSYRLKLKDNTIIIKNKKDNWYDILTNFDKHFDNLLLHNEADKYQVFKQYLLKNYNEPTKK